MKQTFLIVLSALFLAPSTAFCQWHSLGSGTNPCHATRTYDLCVDIKGNIYASGIFNDSTTPMPPGKHSFFQKFIKQ